MEVLLGKVGILDLKYEKLRNENNFNIFSILRDKGDEVNLHSNFISELLSPIGSHGKGDQFLKLFLEKLGIKNFSIENTVVEKERYKIDILIENGSQAIIIENKVWADDQDRQLERYYKKIASLGYDDIWLVYLTPHEHMPSEKSIGDLDKEVVDQMITISYSFHIADWVEKCIELSSRRPTLRETLIQYKSIIGEITGKSMNQEEVNELYDLLSKNDNVINASKIVENWKHVRWHLEWDFWNDFEKVVKQEYEILDYQKYSVDCLNSVIHKSRNRNFWYGLMFKIDSIGDVSLYLFIERGDWEMYYGITVFEGDEKADHQSERYAHFEKKIKEHCEWSNERYWLGGRYLSPRINFEKCSEENTLRLIDKGYRQRYIEANWCAIQDFVQDVRESLRELKPKCGLVEDK